MPEENPTPDSFQPMPALDQATEAALRDSIKADGVVVPIVRDQHGRLIDGHQRVRIAEQLGITDIPERGIIVKDDADAMRLAHELNLNRRHLTKEQRVRLTANLRATGDHSLRAIASVTGVSPEQVRKDLASAEAQQVSTKLTGEAEAPAEASADDAPTVSEAAPDMPQRVRGRDDKLYPARQASTTRKPRPATRRKAWMRKAQDTAQQVAQLRTELAEQGALAGASDDDVKSYIDTLDDIIASASQVRERLMKRELEPVK